MPSQAPTLSPGETAVSPTPLALPLPSITDAADIAAALFDPARVADGVVSLVDTMGVAVLDDTGTVIRPGHGYAGVLSLTESQVRGWISETVEDLGRIDEKGGPFPLANMFAALKSSLPADYSLDDLASAYDRAYEQNPHALAAAVMRGQKLDAHSGLLRVQMWLLLIDAFLRPDAASGLGHSSLALAAHKPAILAASAGGGVAAQYTPQLTSPVPGYSDIEWEEVLACLPDLGTLIPFTVKGVNSTHEGHGTAGPILQFTAEIGTPPDFSVSRVLAAGRQANSIDLTWETLTEDVLNDHGKILGKLGSSVSTTSGISTIEYAVKQEPAATPKYLQTELADFGARVDAGDLVRQAFEWPVSFDLDLAIEDLAGGSRAAQAIFDIQWHTEKRGWQVHIDWSEVYDGLTDTITFDGFVSEDSTAGGVISMSGTGTATGARRGWARCNPGMGVPDGSGNATFIATQTGDVLAVGAFADGGTPLAGVETGSFIFDFTQLADHRDAELELGPLVGDPCLHSEYGGGMAFIRPLLK